MPDPILNAVANEARLKAAQIAEASANWYLKGLEDASLALAPLINGAQAKAQAGVLNRQAVQDDTGTVISDGFGPYSAIDTLLRKERFAAKGGCVDYVKANPTCTEPDAIAAWTKAGLAGTGLPSLLQDPALLGVLYRQNLKAAGLVLDTTWEAQRAWLVATDKVVIMGA